MASPTSLLLLPCILTLSLSLIAAQVCGPTANFSANSTFARNRGLLLSSLATNVTAQDGFYSGSIGDDSDTVYVLALCRPDISEAYCFDCVNKSSQNMLKTCPNNTSSVDWGDQSDSRCITHYANTPISGIMNTRPAVFVWIQNNISHTQYSNKPQTGVADSHPPKFVWLDEFNLALDDLVQNLILTASEMGSSKKFAIGERNYTESGKKVYALVQCTPDLTPSDCSECINGAMDDYRRCCKDKVGVNILFPSCIFRYSLSKFYNVDGGDLPAPPPSTVAVFTPLPSARNNSIESHKSNSRVKIIIIVLVPTVLVIILIFGGLHLKMKVEESSQSGSPNKMPWTKAAAGLFRVRGRGSKRHSSEVASPSANSFLFDLATLRDVTNNFSNANKLGEGAFGLVYKGRLPNGQEIAIKRLASSSTQGESQFKNEIMSLAQLQHRNLVHLLGFCLEGKERLLIYEFMSNGSLDRFIFDPLQRKLLNWDTRYKVIVGIAQGLLYLHEEAKHQIIHRDLKAANILLDDDMNPRIADFGTARLLDIDQSRGQTKIIAGTLGYMPPEYLQYGKFSVKTDIFSFGVIMLEIVAGLKNSDSRESNQIDHLLSYAWNNWRKGKASSLIDPAIVGGSRSEMMRCIHIGLLCAQENAATRPPMSSVVLMLNCFSISLPSPSKPGFWVHRGKESNRSLEDQLYHEAKELDQSSERPANSSINNVTISDYYPR